MAVGPGGVATLVDVASTLNFDLTAESERAVSSGEDITFKTNASLVSFWTRTDPNKPEEPPMRISLMSPAGKELQRYETTVNLAKVADHRHTAMVEAFMSWQPGGGR